MRLSSVEFRKCGRRGLWSFTATLERHRYEECMVLGKVWRVAGVPDSHPGKWCARNAFGCETTRSGATRKAAVQSLLDAMGIQQRERFTAGTAFVFDGHDYLDCGRFVYNRNGDEVMTVVLDHASEYWIAEANNGEAVRVHVNEEDARMTAIKALLASDDC